MKNKGAEVSLVLVLALSLLVIATIPAGAQITATVSIDDITLEQGATRTIPIMIDEAPDNVSSAQINLTYKSTVVHVIAVENKSFDHFVYNPLVGEVKMVGVQWWPPLTAPVTFADVTLKAVGNPGDYTSLNLEGKVYMETGSPYVVKRNNGSVTITAPPTPVPEYNIFGLSALMGLLAIILAISIRAKKK